jgi:hypothetical protein
LNHAIAARESYLRRRLNVDDDRIGSSLTKINQYISKMRMVRIENNEQLQKQVIEQHTQTAVRALADLIIIHDRSQQLITNSTLRTKLDETIRNWKEVTTTIDTQIVKEKKQEVLLPDMDVDEFLDMLYLARWVTDSEHDIKRLVDADISPENLLVIYFSVILILFSIHY